jgi:hypothetical protein
MAEEKKAPRSTDRRALNAKVPFDRRGTGKDRRSTCPECGSALVRQVKKSKTGTVTTILCSRCLWNKASEQIDADHLVTKLTWSLPLEKRGAMHHLAFPHELIQALGLADGDHLVLKPVTSTLGSLDMRWMLEVKKRQTKPGPKA